MNNTIFTITKALEDLFLAIPDSGELTEEQILEYENLGMAMAEKQENTLRLYRRCELDEEMIEAELTRLKSLKTHLNNKKASILKLIGYSMLKMDVQELNFGSIKATKRLNPPSVVIDPAIDLPTEYTRQKISIEADKVKIKTALQEGVIIEGAHLEQDSRIQIS